MIDLTGSVALIPGASGGMGREVARMFAEHGCDVALGYYSREGEAREVLEYAKSLGRRARLARVDTTSLEGVQQWADSVTAEYGKIDILASCVGAHLPEGFSLFLQQDPKTWHGMIEAQMMSFIYLSRAVLPQMVARKSGRLLSIGSDSGKVGESGVAVATAGHGGLIAFAKAISREVGRSGVTANIVCPGPTEGPTLDKLRSQGTTGSRIVEELTKRVPMKRLGTSRDIASAMLFLASKEAGYITGQALSVSGGLVMN
ncbi:MAG: SDR family NAD(P)-dependent oxidoreductase [Burkholderiales bacterium]